MSAIDLVADLMRAEREAAERYAQILARHADPRTTEHYDRARVSVGGYISDRVGGINTLSGVLVAVAATLVLCGLAGSYLVLAQSSSFAPNMTAGRGFMALAAMIFGKWKPLPTMGACLLFGFLDAVAIRMQGVQLPGIGHLQNLEAPDAFDALVLEFLREPRTTRLH